MKIYSPTQVGVICVCRATQPVMAANGSVQHYEHTFECTDEHALISDFAKVRSKFNTITMPVDLTQPLIAVGDSVSVMFERRCKQYNCQPPKVWWVPVSYSKYTPTGTSTSTTGTTGTTGTANS